MQIKKPKKLIMMLVDALREDFVDFDMESKTDNIRDEIDNKVNRAFLDTEHSVY